MIFCPPKRGGVSIDHQGIPFLGQPKMYIYSFPDTRRIVDDIPYLNQPNKFGDYESHSWSVQVDDG